MPYLPQETLDNMLSNLPFDQRKVISDIMHGKVSATVKCLSEDTYQDVEQPVLDKNNEPVLQTKGENKGQPKTEKVKTLVQPGCKGRVIAYIYQDDPNDPSKKRVVPSTTDNVSKMFLYQSRPRLDGQWGFHCRCGNNSLLAEAEDGIITSAIPSRSDLETVWQGLQASRKSYPVYKGIQEVDGFTIENTKEII